MHAQQVPSVPTYDLSQLICYVFASAQLTIMALREAELPEGCTRTIYMCDDGKDPLKHDWVESLPEDVIYVSGRRSTPVA